VSARVGVSESTVSHSVQAYRYYASTLCTLYAREQLPVWAARHLLRRLYSRLACTSH